MRRRELSRSSVARRRRGRLRRARSSSDAGGGGAEQRGASGRQLDATAFKQGLKEAGYIEGQNVAIEYRWAEDHYDRLPALAADLVRRQVAVIFANTSSAPAAKAATTTIPIVFQIGSDPVKDGLVASLNRPGGNLTGVVSLNAEVGPKRLELMHEVVPTATNIALLVNPANPIAEPLIQRWTGGGTHAWDCNSISCVPAPRATSKRPLRSLAELRAGALVIGADAFFSRQSAQLAALAMRYAHAVDLAVSTVRRGWRPDELRRQ